MGSILNKGAANNRKGGSRMEWDEIMVKMGGGVDYGNGGIHYGKRRIQMIIVKRDGVGAAGVV